MRRIIVTNPTLDHTYQTFLDAVYSSGTTLTVKSTVSFTANDLLVVGEPSEEFSELKKLSSLTAPSTFTLASALNFSHNKEAPIYKSLWDNVSIEGRSSSAGTFAELTQSAIQWDSKTNETIYFHSDGTDTWQYRFRFYNSVTATYSEYSPTISGAEPARKVVSTMIMNVRKLVNDLERKIVSDAEIIRFLNVAQDIIYSHNPKYWFLLVDTYKGSSGIVATAGTNVYSLATYTTFGHLDSIRYKYTSGGTNILYHLKRIPTIEFDAKVRDLNKTNDDIVRFYKFLPVDSSSANGYFQVDPTPKNNSVGTFFPNYYKKMADLDSVDDTTQVLLPSILEDFAIGQIWKIRGNEDRGNFYEAQFYGPADRTKDIRTVTGIALLDDLDDQQRKAQAQPQALVRFRGHKYESDFFGEDLTRNPDYIRETYF